MNSFKLNMEITKQTYMINEDTIVVQNISNCIHDKLSILNIKLTKLAEYANIDYFTLRKIVNIEPGYMPNLRILIKLATFLNIKVGDLLNYNNLPQYIPVINISEIESFLKNNIKLFGFKNTVFSEKYIHEQAFGIKELNQELIIPAEIIYICYPNNNKILIKDQVYLFQLDHHIKNLVFGRVISTDNKNIKISVGQDILTIINYNIIAIVVNIQINETLI